jgi:hypothetical protein
MHGYSNSCKSRRPIIYGIALASIAICPVVNSIASQLQLLGPIASSSLYYGLFALVDQFAWRLSWLSRLFGTPDLSGGWDVSGITSGADGVERSWTAVVSVTQTWPQISVVLVSENSTSLSKVAGLQVLPGQGCRLVYTYDNHRTADEASLINHRGTCELHFEKHGERATAYYFTDRNRKTVGSMTWTKQEGNRN